LKPYAPSKSSNAGKAAAAAGKVQERFPELPPSVARAAARLAFFRSKAARLAEGAKPSAAGAAKPSAAAATKPSPAAAAAAPAGSQTLLGLSELLRVPEVHLLQQHPTLNPELAGARAQGVADAEAQVLRRLHPYLGPQALKPETLEGLSTHARWV
jgi:hypothetical protein